MRKTCFLFFLSCLLIVGISSCKEDLMAVDAGMPASLTVTIPQGIQQRSASDYGTGASVNRCILEIYRNGVLYGERLVQPVSGGEVVFSGLRLVASQSYDFVLWADCADGLDDKYYNTTDLTAVTVKDAYTGNDDGYDAFFAHVTYEVDGAFSQNITLTRPFGQLNVKTNDAAEIADGHDDLKPTHVKVDLASVPTSFNVLTGEAGNPQPLSYTAAVEDVEAGELTVDYILASDDEADLHDFTMTFLNNGTTINTNDNFNNIPVRRNYRTNVSGNLLTKSGELVVTIDPGFEEMDYAYEYLIEAATNGGSVTLNSDLVFSGTMPALVVPEGKTLEIDLNGHTIDCKLYMKDAIHVDGGTLIVNGDGEIKATDEGYYAIWATGDANVVINGGSYLGNGSCIQAKDNAHIEINGGYFKVAQPYNGVYFVVNLQDNQPNTITITGGTFENCDPANTNTEPAGVSDNFVAEGYSSVKISDSPAPFGTYQVVKSVNVSDMSGLQTAIQTIAAEGGALVIDEAADIDISALNAGLEINHPTTITLNGRLSSNNEAVRIVNNSVLTINGDGVANMQRRVVENYGTLTVEGGTYTTSVNNGGTAFWNNSPDAVMTLNNVDVDASFFAVAGAGEIHINGGSISSTSSNKYGSWAYCVRAQEGATMTIKDAVIEGVQGAIASIEESKVTVENVTVSARNSEPGRQDAFYAIYAASLGTIEVISGDFYSDRKPCGMASDDDQAGAPLGGLILKGGRYSSQPVNDGGTIWPAEQGYKYVDTGDSTYPYSIVKE